MAVSKGNTSSDSANTASLAFSHTLAGGSSLVVVQVQINGNVTVTGVDYGASAMTFLGRRNHLDVATVEIWYIEGVSTSETITVNLSSMERVCAGAVDWAGADTPDNFVSRLIDAETSSSLTIAGDTSDNFIFDCILQRDGILTVGADQTQEWNISFGGAQNAGSTQPGSSGGVMSWSWDTSDDGAHAGCRIPASAVVDERHQTRHMRQSWGYH